MNVHYFTTGIRQSGTATVLARSPAGFHPGDLVENTLASSHERAFQMAMVYPAELGAVSQARRQLHSLLVSSGLSAIADAMTLGAHELMANAVTHGCRHQPVSAKAFTVQVTYVNGRVRVEVQDPSDKWPLQRPPSDEREGGRGLFLVDAVAARWGVQPSPGRGKTVWMELDVPNEGAAS